MTVSSVPERDAGVAGCAPPRGGDADELFDKAAAALRRMLAAEPRNAAALARLGDLERRRGDFAAALTACRRLLAVAPDDAEAAWLVAVLGGDRLPAAPAAGRAVPFVRMTDFLPPAARDRLLRDVLAARERFAPARVRGVNARIVLNREIRDALVLDEPTTRDIGSWFVPKLRAVLPEMLWRLRMEDLDPGRIETKVAVHLNGGFLAAHRDDGALGNARHRIVSYVCYFHRVPRPFAGGDLLLHDAGRAGGGAGAFSRIEPLCGSIVFFPSDCLHEITPVACGAEFGDGRFTVHGWIWSGAAGRSCGPAAVTREGGKAEC